MKPIAEDLRTNLVIITDRRAYHLELTSTPETYMASVSWHYPRDELLALTRRNAAAEEAADRVIDSGLDIDKLRFRYAVSGDTPPWRPARVFDDSAQGLHPVPGPDSTRARRRRSSSSGRTAKTSSSTTASAAATTSSTACSPPPNCGSARTRNRSCASPAPTVARPYRVGPLK